MNQILNATQERKRCNRLVIIPWRNTIPFQWLIGDQFGVDVKRNENHFGIGIISGSIWRSFQGWGSFRGRDHFGCCTDPLLPRTYRLIFGLFLKLKIFWCADEAFRIVFASKTQKISRYYYFSRIITKIPAIKCAAIRVWSKYNHPTIGWRQVKHGTQARTWLVDSLFYIKCSLENNAFSVLHYVIKVTSHYWHYCMLHRFEIFSAPGTIAHGSVRLPPRSHASSRGCPLAIIFIGSFALTSQWLLCIICFTSLVSFTGFYNAECEPLWFNPWCKFYYHQYHTPKEKKRKFKPMMKLNDNRNKWVNMTRLWTIPIIII